MTISYALAATNAICASSILERLAIPDDMLRVVNEGDLMACITITSGAVLTIPIAYLRITGPRQLRGMFDACIGHRFEDGVTYTLNASDIVDLDYFVL